MIEATGVVDNTLTRFTDGDIINIEVEHVAAVEVTDSHITHATVSAQVNGIFIPVALHTAAAAALDGFASAIAHALGAHRPFLEHGKGARVGVGRRNGNAKVLSSIHIVLCASIESQDTTQLHLRRNEVVIGIKDLTQVVALANHEVIRGIVTRLTSHNLTGNQPTIAITVGVD